MKLTREMVLKGTEFTKLIDVEEYGGAEVEIRPLSDEQLAKVISEGTLENALRDSEAINRLKTTDTTKLTKDEIGVIAKQLVGEGAVGDNSMLTAMNMARRACEYGIVDDELRSTIGSFAQGATVTIGMAIIDMSTGNVDEVMDFITAQTGN